MILQMRGPKEEKLARLKELHEKVKEALDVEPIQVQSVEEAGVWCSVNELDIALDDMFPEENRLS